MEGDLRLDPNNNEIRVLHLEPNTDPTEADTVRGDELNPIRCRRQVVSLQSLKPGVGASPQLTLEAIQAKYRAVHQIWGDASSGTSAHPDSESDRFEWGDFAALSYVWGDPAAQEIIMVDGQPTKIQKSLACAFRYLRMKQPIQDGLKLWVDVLCINQNDPIERNEHVLRMGSIYQQAKQVLYWLGDADEASNHALDLISRVATEWRKNAQDRWQFSLRELRPDLCRSQGWLSILKFMRRSFWRRVWIQQEVAMGRADMPLLCGHKAIAWGELHEALYLAAYRDLGHVETLLADEITRDNGPTSHLWNADPLRRDQVYQLNTIQRKLRKLTAIADREALLAHRIAAVLHFSRSSEASNDRDKVYGIASLLPSAVTSLMLVDYQLSVEQVYTSFTKAVIRGIQALDILDHCVLTADQHTPSWVPDWRISGHARLFGGIKYIKPRKASLDIKPVTHFNDAEELLTAEGCRIDIIDGLGKSSDSTNVQYNVQRQLFQSRRSASMYENSPENICDVLWRTYTANINRNGDPAPEYFADLLDLYGGSANSTGSDLAGVSLQRLHCLGEVLRDTADLQFAGKPIHEHLSDRSSAPRRVKGTMTSLGPALERVHRTFINRRLAVTIKGYLCVVPNASLPDDVIVVLFGCSLPVVLRPDEVSGHWTVVGTCYCHGVSQGEAMERLSDGGLQAESFVLQ
ncbi:uncharacterized protein AB675_10958 [Cyphellophora attinorum]|uniref:Heterokaryon incompatibility domain-containing protein n=1 Tax=Cyphellophora attinorum TaxID=1664694 RepID=A0A0N0NII8_9EURO|nr:uncharacterized protein AB675_10958 [Phialophora attinorum]KPI35489.1 hypothetical protein AB675_10958 [Phialophora attinorum]